MNELERKMLVRLTFEPDKMSRNKNFETFQDPTFARLRKRAAHLRSLLTMLESSSPEDVCFEQEEPGEPLELQIDNISGGRRIAFIPIEEYGVLFDDGDARELLEETHEAPFPAELRAP